MNGKVVVTLRPQIDSAVPTPEQFTRERVLTMTEEEASRFPLGKTITVDFKSAALPMFSMKDFIKR